MEAAAQAHRVSRFAMVITEAVNGLYVPDRAVLGGHERFDNARDPISLLRIPAGQVLVAAVQFAASIR
jgi:hypothetical protein